MEARARTYFGAEGCETCKKLPRANAQTSLRDLVSITDRCEDDAVVSVGRHRDLPPSRRLPSCLCVDGRPLAHLGQRSSLQLATRAKELWGFHRKPVAQQTPHSPDAALSRKFVTKFNALNMAMMADARAGDDQCAFEENVNAIVASLTATLNNVGDDRDAAELREIAALQREIAEQEALLDEHQSQLVRCKRSAYGGASGARGARGARALTYVRSHMARGR